MAKLRQRCARRHYPVSTAFLRAQVSLILATGMAAAYAVPLQVSDNITFRTVNQSMWSSGHDMLLDESFEVTVVDIHTGERSIGAISQLSTSIPNPKYLAWKVAYDGCRVAFSDSVCRNGATIPFVGQVGGLGNAPAQTLSVNLGKNGLELTSNIDLEAGFKGRVALDGGKVNVTYPTQVTLQSDKSSYAPGETVTLSFSELVGTPSMTTQFSTFDASLSAFGSFQAKADIEAYLVNEGGKVTIVDTGPKPFEQELFGVEVGAGDIGLRIFGRDPIVVDTSGGIGLNVFKVQFPPESPLAIPLADFQIQVPSLDTPPHSSWNATTNTLVNTQLPIDRSADGDDDLSLIGSGTGFHRTDVAKLDVDVDGILSVAIQPTLPLGLVGGITGLLSVEGNLLDFDLGAFLGFGQTLTFEPTLRTELEFSKPVYVEVAGEMQEITTWAIGVGEELSFIMPDGDFQIQPKYYLDNTFSNLTELLVSPVATIAALQLKLTGILPSALGADFDAALLQHVLPLSDPISVATLGSSDPFSLEGFDVVMGSGLQFLDGVGKGPTAPFVVPAPSTLALLFAAFAGLCLACGRRAVIGNG